MPRTAKIGPDLRLDSLVSYISTQESGVVPKISRKGLFLLSSKVKIQLYNYTMFDLITKVIK